ncbi:hypothetical protein RJ639_016551 [Escallonia herrerae]|uniref:Uncharacterized protein n=1 Tax=Escallonia herrerae TaxID=1293975 RepID=A0AA89AJC6_9ASTE|nr:hypothetical protein RJ639_016551 [Escallonia herrerae]
MSDCDILMDDDFLYQYFGGDPNPTIKNNMMIQHQQLFGDGGDDQKKLIINSVTPIMPVTAISTPCPEPTSLEKAEEPKTLSLNEGEGTTREVDGTVLRDRVIENQNSRNQGEIGDVVTVRKRQRTKRQLKARQLEWGSRCSVLKRSDPNLLPNKLLERSTIDEKGVVDTDLNPLPNIPGESEDPTIQEVGVAEETDPNPLPKRFKKRIHEKGGKNVVLVIQKSLFQTDVSETHCRFSIPVNQVKGVKFLTKAEMKKLDKRAEGGHCGEIPTLLIEPNLGECEIKLSKWSLRTCSMYVLLKPWKEVVQRNKLEKGMDVQLWSFRVGSELGFALVVEGTTHEAQGTASGRGQSKVLPSGRSKRLKITWPGQH